MLHLFFATAVIFVIISFGYLLRLRRLIDAPFNRQLSLLLVNVFYPALIVSSLTRNFTWSTLLRNWTLPAGSALIMLTGWAVGTLCLPLLRRQPPRTVGMFRFQCMLNNYSFLPIMLATLLLDEQGVARIVFSTIGAETVVWTLGVRVLTGFRASRREVLRNLLSLPMLAMLTGIALLLLRHLLASAGAGFASQPLAANIVTMFDRALHMTGQATIPVSAVIVGARMAALERHHIFTRLAACATGLRLLLIPAAAMALIVWLPFPAEVRPVLLIVAAQPCSMASVTLAEVYDSDASFGAATVLLTHLFALLTIPLWLAAPWFR
jgi:predicted permease